MLQNGAIQFLPQDERNGETVLQTLIHSSQIFKESHHVDTKSLIPTPEACQCALIDNVILRTKLETNLCAVVWTWMKCLHGSHVWTLGPRLVAQLSEFVGPLGSRGEQWDCGKLSSCSKGTDPQGQAQVVNCWEWACHGLLKGSWPYCIKPTS